MKFSLLIYLFVSLFTVSDSVVNMHNTLQGSFIISDRPDDFKSIVVWTQSNIEIEGFQDCCYSMKEQPSEL